MSAVPLQEFQAVQDACEQLRVENGRLRGALEESTEWFEQLFPLVGKVLDDMTAHHLKIRARINRAALKTAKGE